MKRTMLLLATMAFAVLLVGGVALAAKPSSSITCTGDDCFGTQRGETITGTDTTDYIYAYGGADKIDGNEGVDYLDGGTGNDTIDARDNTSPTFSFEVIGGGDGNDTIYADDDVIDHIFCGAGKKDVVHYDAGVDGFVEGNGPLQFEPSSDCEKAFAN
jgi:Ca2+-binding RTX toxin-like protein